MMRIKRDVYNVWDWRDFAIHTSQIEKCWFDSKGRHIGASDNGFLRYFQTQKVQAGILNCWVPRVVGRPDR